MTTSIDLMRHPDGSICPGDRCEIRDTRGHTIAADYAWTITDDHLDGPGPAGAAGTFGPRNAPDDLVDLVKAGKGHRFDLWDGDWQRYYSGVIATRGDMGEEEHCAAPLVDFGTGYAGCAAVTYPGHPEWDVS